MNAKISAFVVRVEAIIYLILHNLHDYTFNKVANLVKILQHRCFPVNIAKF